MINIGGTDIVDIAIGSTPLQKVYLGNSLIWEKSSPVLPYDSVVEYIQSNATQWIDPQYTTNANSIICIDAQLDVLTKQVRLLGNSAGNFEIYINSKTRWGYISNNVTASASPANTSRHCFRIDNVRTKRYVDNVSANITKNGETYYNSVFLFGRENSLMSNGKLYSACIYDNTSAIVDLIPVRVGQIGYMYDRVNGDLYRSASSTDFTCGSDIPAIYDAKIEYIEGTGTQWIDTGIHSFVGDSVSIQISSTNYNEQLLCGTRTGGSTADSFFIVAESGKVTFAINGKYFRTNVNIQDGNIHTIKSDISGGYVDGTHTSSVTMTTMPAVMTYSIFTVHNESAPTSMSSFKLYRFTYKRNNKTIMDLIPVRVGQVGYMYDKVTEQLLGNAGTGDFTLGPDIT